MVCLAEADLYTSLASPGTKARDAVGGAFRTEWREGPVRTGLQVRSHPGLVHFCEYRAYRWVQLAGLRAVISGYHDAKTGVRFRAENSQSSCPSTLATLHEESDCRTSTTTVLE
jgi:hypothetical protein